MHDPKPGPRRGFELRRGAPFFLGHLAVCLLVQAESAAVLHRELGLGPGETLGVVASLPLLQIQHVAASLLPGLLGALGRRATAHGVLLALNLVVVLDQVAFRVFFHHVDPGMDETRIGDLLPMLRSLWDSAVAAGGVLTLFNLVVVAVVSVAVARSRPRPLSAGLRRRVGFAAVAWLAVSAPATCVLDDRGLQQHAVFALLQGLWREPAPPAEIELSSEEILTPEYDSVAEPAEVDGALADALRQLQSRQRPNVLLVVMESVGTLQLFPDGEIDARITPTLAALLDDAVVFTDLYTTFPATIRSLIGLHTGGSTITWGSVQYELGFPDRGPTLVSRFRELGYRSALYSAGDMNFENMGDYLVGLGFDAVVDAGRQSDAFRARHAIHSWGVADDAMRGDALRFMLERDAAGEPFLVEYITVSTHHPYGVPKGIPRLEPGSDARSRYRSALHYSDGFIGRLLEELRRNGLLERTLVVITGDHGQAFGDRHPGNLLHKNHLYEENVKTFAILAAPGADTAPVTSRRVGTMGDILPTLLRVVGGDTTGFWGQSLWPGDYAPRIAYFHKAAPPDEWGLRDGRYKFIAPHVDGSAVRLFDLAADPGEAHNLAPDAPEQVARYRLLCEQWYAAVNQSYVARLEGHTVPGGSLRPSEVATAGPKRLAVGVRAPDGRGRESGAIVPSDQVVAWSFWVPDPDGLEAEFVWTSPTHATFRQRTTVSPLQNSIKLPLAAPRPLEPGTWRVAILVDGQERIGEAFTVREARAPDSGAATP